MAKSGAELGADLYDLWKAGTHLLPAAAADVMSAWSDTPATIAYAAERSEPVGMGANGPAGAVDGVLKLLNQALIDTSSNLDATGQALVWVADEYARTDHAAAAELHRRRQELGGVK